MQEFLGFGLLRPFQRDGRADFAAVGGEQRVRSAVGQIFGTVRASELTHGELPWRTEFGSLLNRLRHQRNDDIVRELARVHTIDALKRWEPRIRVTSVQTACQQEDGEEGKKVLAIRIRYNFTAASEQEGGVRYSDVEHIPPVACIHEEEIS